MRILHFAFVGALCAVPLSAQNAPVDYFPPRGEWETRTPDQVGMDADKLEAAVRYAVEHESRAPRELSKYISTTLANEPHGEIIGPVRGPRRRSTESSCVRRGYIVAEWGPTTTRRHDVQRHQDLPVDSRRSGGRPRHDPLGGGPECSGLRTDGDHFDGPSTTPRSPGTICCDRPATGAARCGASPIGPIDQPGASPSTTYPTNRCTSRGRSTSTTTCA